MTLRAGNSDLNGQRGEGTAIQADFWNGAVMIEPPFTPHNMLKPYQRRWADDTSRWKFRSQWTTRRGNGDTGRFLEWSRYDRTALHSPQHAQALPAPLGR